MVAERGIASNWQHVLFVKLIGKSRMYELENWIKREFENDIKNVVC